MCPYGLALCNATIVGFGTFDHFGHYKFCSNVNELFSIGFKIFWLESYARTRESVGSLHMLLTLV